MRLGILIQRYFSGLLRWAQYSCKDSIYLFLVVLGLCCCAWAFPSYGKWGLLFVGVHRPLTVVVSLGEHRLQTHRLQQLWLVGSRAQAGQLWPWVQLLHSMWNLPGPGMKPVSPASAGGFLPIAPPGQSNHKDSYEAQRRQSEKAV